MKTKVAAMGAAAIFVMVSLAFVLPAMAATSTTSGALSPSVSSTSQTTGTNAHQPRPDHDRNRIDLKVGQTVTLSSIEGGYRVVGNASQNGTASGTLQLNVTSALKQGYALSVTSGTVTIGTQTYTVTGGSAELGPYGVYMVGQGTASGASFLFHARSIGSFGGVHNAVVRMDISNGTTEYVVRLLVTVTY